MRYILTLLISFSLLSLNGQNEYSYSTDKRFFDPSDLLGYNFVPIKLEIPNVYDEQLGPGEYSFGITLNNLYVKGGDIEGIYNLNNINPTVYGFKLTHINPRNPAQSGHLKIIKNPQGHVNALVFKKSNKEAELILHLPELPAELAEEEQEYFTDNLELEVSNIDSIWGTVIFPFHRIYVSQVIQQRLQPRDSTSIYFYEKIELVEKKKKKRGKKAKKSKDVVDTLVDSMKIESQHEAADTAVVLKEIISEESPADTLSEKVPMEMSDDLKEVRSYFIDYKTRLLYQDGSEEVKTQTFEIKKVKERTDEEAQEGEEKYQLAFTTENGDEIYIYLLSNRTVSSIEIGDELLFMRGY